MSELLSRRAVLLGGSALAVMAACGKKTHEISVGGHTSTTQGHKTELQTVQAGFNFQTGIDERITFALLQGVPPTLFNGGEVKVAFQKPGTQQLTEFVVAERKSEGVEARPYYVAHHTFDAAGDWGMQATAAGMKPGNLVFHVDDPTAVQWPVPGGKLPATKTPTTADPMGVNPICTHSPGPCPFHGDSLDTLVGKNGRPTIVLLATPALCQSQTCGPVLDILTSQTEPFRDKLNIVHIEIYTDMSGKTPSPAFSAFNLNNEPVCYFADKSGTIVNRFNGVFDKTEATAAIQQLLA